MGQITSSPWQWHLAVSTWPMICVSVIRVHQEICACRTSRNIGYNLRHTRTHTDISWPVILLSQTAELIIGKQKKIRKHSEIPWSHFSTACLLAVRAEILRPRSVGVRANAFGPAHVHRLNKLFCKTLDCAISEKKHFMLKACRKCSGARALTRTPNIFAEGVFGGYVPKRWGIAFSCHCDLIFLFVHNVMPLIECNSRHGSRGRR